MKPGQIRDLEDEALLDHIAATRRDLFGLRMQHATGELENTSGLVAATRDLARALTAARHRGLDPAVASTRRAGQEN